MDNGRFYFGDVPNVYVSLCSLSPVYLVRHPIMVSDIALACFISSIEVF